MATGTSLQTNKAGKRSAPGTKRAGTTNSSRSRSDVHGTTNGSLSRSDVQGLLREVKQLRKEVVAYKMTAASVEDVRKILKLHGLILPLKSLGTTRKRQGVSTNPVKAESVIAATSAGGQAQLLAWVADKTLLPSVEFAKRRGVERQALAKTAARNALFGLKVNNRVYYPALLADMTAKDSDAVCEALGTMSPGKKLLFLLRKHGGLGGQTVAEAVDAKRERVLELAHAWADEDRAHA